MRVTYEAVLLDLFGTLVDDSGAAIDGARSVLACLADARWAIVTSCPRALADYLLASAALPAPAHVIVAEDVAAGKPAPDGYLLAAQRLAVDPVRCLVVEDSAQGIAAGRSAGMDVVALLRGKPPGFAGSATFTLDAIRDLRLESGPRTVALVLDEREG